MQLVFSWVKKAGKAVIGFAAFVVAVQRLWSLWNGDYEFLTAISIVVGVFICLAISIYVAIKKEQSTVSQEEVVYSYPPWSRRLALLAIPLNLLIVVVAGFLWLNKVRIPPTPEGRVGIWVARLRGDDTKFSAQRGMIQTLEYFLAEQEDLRSFVEVRELPVIILGRTPAESDQYLDQMGQRYGASIIVWGEIAGFKLDDLYPVVTVVRRMGIKERTLRLTPITETARQREQHTFLLGLPSATVHLSLEHVREPLQLARFILAVAFYQKQNWGAAAQQLDQFIANKLSRAVDVPDVYMYAGEYHFFHYQATGGANALSKAHQYFSTGLLAYKEEQKWQGYAVAQTNLGVTHSILAERGVEPEANLQRSITALQEAARLWKEQQNWAAFAATQTNLGVRYELLAGRGIEPEVNLQRSITALQEAARLWKEQQNWTGPANAQINEGLSYQLLARWGVEPEANLQRSITALQEGARIFKERQDWEDYTLSQTSLGAAFWSLAERGIEPEANLQRSLAALQEAVRLTRERQDLAGFASAQTNLGLSYQLLARRGVEPEANLQRSIAVLQEAARVWEKWHNWEGLARVQLNLGETYRTLAEQCAVSRVKLMNLRLARAAFEEAHRISREINHQIYQERALRGLTVLLEALFRHGMEAGKNADASK